MLTETERKALTVIGVLALAALAILWWQRHHAPLAIEGEPVPAPQYDQALAAARRVDVNTASVAELERLPQVGPALAWRIVEYRTTHGPFRSAEDLAKVRGIGSKLVDALRAHITME